MKYKKMSKKFCSVVLSSGLILQMSIPAVYANEKEFEQNTNTIMIASNIGGTTTGSAINPTLSIAEQLQTLNIGDAITINTDQYTYKGEVSSTGLNIGQSEYAIDGKHVIYKAGYGYILVTWTTQVGGSYIITLHDVNIDIVGTGDIDAINIFGKLDITLEGENKLKAPRNAINSSNSSPTIILKGDGVIDMESSLCGVRAEMGYVTIQDNVVLNSQGAKWGVVGGYYEDVIIKDNAKLNILVRAENESEFENYAIRCGNLYVRGNAKVDTNGEHPFISTRIRVEVEPTATLNAIGRGVLSSNKWPHTIYGTVTLLENITADFGAAFKLNGPFSSAPGARLINNGTIKINDGVSLEQIQSLNITNNGKLMLGNKAVQLIDDILYEDKGEITGDIDLKINMPTEPTYYKKSDGYMLVKPGSGTENTVIKLHNLKTDINKIIFPDQQLDIIVE